MSERARQQQVLADVRADNPHLRAYRANADAAAARALAAAFPTLTAMLGAAGLAAVARDLWRDSPPQRGDLAEWGDALPAWIDAQPSLAEWPWLADSARLDWALHQCERAADAGFDAGSLQALAETEPARLRLQLMPGSALLESRWPIATLHAAHAGGGDDGDDSHESDGEAALTVARAALAAPRAEAVLVARAGWRALPYRIESAHLPWWRAVFAGRSLEHALLEAGPDFDFAAWLAEALAHGWLKALAVAAD